MLLIYLPQVGLSGVLLYAQPSLASELKKDGHICKLVSEGRLLVVRWDAFRLKKAKEARRAATSLASEDNAGPRQVPQAQWLSPLLPHP